MSQYILSIDQGTTGTTASLVDETGRMVDSEDLDFAQIFPKPGWVEHDAEVIWSTVEKTVTQLLAKTKIPARSIRAIGITNQRETVVAWDKTNGRSIYNALVWQCRRTTEYCNQLKKKKTPVKIIKKLTGLVVDPYFSASKIRWLLKNVPAVKNHLKDSTLNIGTIDSFLLFKLSSGAAFKTDVSNASRTQLMNIKTLNWDDKLLRLFSVPKSILPEVCPSSGVFGVTRGLSFLPDGIPISGIAGDQQAALFGQTAFEAGESKCTFGTGSFLLMNTGNKIVPSKFGMLTTVAWQIKGEKPVYALEGGAFVCGAAVQWLRDGLGLISHSHEVENLAKQVETTEGVEFVPALTGLGAPYWRAEARGVICGLTRGTTKAHIARATLEAMALQNAEILFAMQKDLGTKLKAVRVDGGATANDLLMQTQANYIGAPVLRPKNKETTSLGAALLAGLGAGVWKSKNELRKLWVMDQEFKNQYSSAQRKKRMESWKLAIAKA